MIIDLQRSVFSTIPVPSQSQCSQHQRGSVRVLHTTNSTSSQQLQDLPAISRRSTIQRVAVLTLVQLIDKQGAAQAEEAPEEAAASVQSPSTVKTKLYVGRKFSFRYPITLKELKLESTTTTVNSTLTAGEHLATLCHAPMLHINNETCPQTPFTSRLPPNAQTLSTAQLTCCPQTPFLPAMVQSVHRRTLSRPTCVLRMGCSVSL